MSFNPETVHLHKMEKKQFALRYQKGQDFCHWQQMARKKLGELLGYPYAAPADDQFQVEWVHTDDPRFDETRFLFASEEDCTVICHLLTPKNAQGPLPVVICLQGHSKGMHISLGRPKFEGDEETISGGDRDFALQIVKKGYAALAIEQRGFGERGGTPKGPACYQPAMQAILLGRTIIGERCFDISRAIDMVEAHFPQLDAKKIAIMGNSGGGTATIYAAAMDERIAAAMPSCAFCGYQASIGELYHCSCNYVPGIMKYFDMGDLAGLIAPRPLVLVNGREDKIFPLHSVDEQAKVAEAAYEAAAAGDQLRRVIGPEGHRFYADLSWPIFDDVTGWGKAE